MSGDERFCISSEDIPMSMTVDDYVVFSNENRDKLIEKIRNGRSIAEKQWEDIVKTGSKEELEAFYTASEYHYDILLPYLHPSDFSKRKKYKKIVDFVRKADGDKLMEFGGGPGQLCLLLHYNTNKDITYVDLPSRIMDFAKWRFKRYNANIVCIEAKIDHCSLPEEEYDVIVSDAVLEHVINVEKTVKTICKSLSPGGLLYLLFDDEEEGLSMHISSQIDIDKVLVGNGLRRIEGPIWTKNDNWRGV